MSTPLFRESSIMRIDGQPKQTDGFINDFGLRNKDNPHGWLAPEEPQAKHDQCLQTVLPGIQICDRASDQAVASTLRNSYSSHNHYSLVLSRETADSGVFTLPHHNFSLTSVGPYQPQVGFDSHLKGSYLERNVKIVASEARRLGVDPTTAVATMLVESHGNHLAVGDHGTSFGLFQLHRGGALGRLSVSDALNPATNARRALSGFVPHLGKHRSPGELASAAQRPLHRGEYARRVNAALAEASLLVRFLSSGDGL